MKILKTLIFVFALHASVHAQTIQDAKKAIEAEYYYKAKMILLKLNATTPGVETNYYLGNVYLLLEQPDSAKFYYQKATAFDDSKNALFYIAMGKLNVLNNQNDKAKENFDYAIKVSKSKSAEVFYQIGEAYYKKNNAEAVKNYEIAYSIDPGFVINLIALGDAYYNMADYAKAKTKYELAVSTNPNLYLGYLKLGRIERDGGKDRYKDAIINFEKVVALDPTIAVAWKELGELYYLTGQYAKVRGSYDKYLELNSEDKESRIVPCISAYQIGDFAYAIECSKGIVANEPNNFVAYRIIAYSYKDWADSLRKADPKADITEKIQGGYEAITQFWNISEKKVKPLDYQYSAKLANEAKDTVKAVFYYSMALENDSTNGEMFSEYAKYLYSTKKYTEAITIYNEKITKFGGGPLDYFYLGRSYYQMEDYAHADSSFAEFLETQPNSLDGWLWRAKSSVLIDSTFELGLAFPFYEKYISLAEVDTAKNKKNLITAYSYMAVYYNLKKENGKMCEYYTKAKTLDPASADVKNLEESGISCSN